MAGAARARGQGTFLVTGQGQGLTTRETVVDFGSAMAPVLEFNFGFATDEVFAPSQLFDSFTVTLASLAGDTASILVTADASGFVWAPASDTGFPFRADDIARESIPFPDAGRTYGAMSAFKVSLPVPADFGAQGVRVTFDLADNLNGAQSLGYFTTPTVVPEPGTVALFAMGIGVALLRSRARR